MIYLLLACIFVKGTISIAPQAEGNTNNGNKKVVFKNWAPFNKCTCEINNAQIENAKNIMLMLEKMLK